MTTKGLDGRGSATPSAGRPRVLFLTPRFPFPVDRGDRLAAYHVLRVFARRFDVTLATFSGEREAERQGLEVFRSWNVRTIVAPLPSGERAARLVRAVVTGHPLQLAYYDDAGLHRRLRALAESEPPFDAVVSHLIRMAPFAADVRASRRVAYLCDSISLGLERRLAHAPWPERPSIWLEAGRVRRFEAAVLRDFDEGWLVSDEDLESFPGPHDKLVVVRHGVDDSLHGGGVSTVTDPVVGFLGHLGVPHNVDAAVYLVEHILPRLRSRGLDARVRLYGASPVERVRALARHPGVELVGFVPDLRSALQSLRVFCAPLRFSSGVQNKLLEALAAGTPVVTSPEAAHALGRESLRWIRVARDADGYADAIAALWPTETRGGDDIDAAREWVRANFRWENYSDRLEAILSAEAAPPAFRTASG